MAKKSSIENNKKRRKLVDRYAGRRAALKAQAKDASLPPEERFRAQLQLQKLPRNSSAVRVVNRCELTGRSKAYYRKFRLSRIALRDLGSRGQLPGVVKSSW